jgi:hypothetical protein
MSNTAPRVTLASFVVMAWPGASFARHGDSVALARRAGLAATGNVPMGGIPRGPADNGGTDNLAVDASGVGNDPKIAPLPPRISAPMIPQFK